MRWFSSITSATLTLIGIGLSTFGILESAYKPLAIGLVFIFGAAIFALLYVGSRRAHIDAAD